MGRMQSKGKGKGISGSCTPYLRKTPKWVANSPSAICELIVKLAKKGHTPSQIGKTLRDSHAIPQVRLLTGQKILRILKKHGCAPEIPEDLYCLIKKAMNIRKHLEKYRKDKDGKYRVILIESRIHRLIRYYKRTQKLPAKFKYNAATATAIISSS
jgi:small subunit ribosomal protein S13e